MSNQDAAQDRRLQRHPELTIQLKADGRAQISVDSVLFDGGLYTLAILEVFIHPATIQQALTRLDSLVMSEADRADLLGQIREMVHSGILFPPDERPNPIATQFFSAPPIHIAMLQDRVRTSRYLQAIRQTVQPGDIVVEIGTGTGVLAVAAAHAGARHIYAIEGTPMGQAAHAVFSANGVIDQITLVEGWSTRVPVERIPERADLLISEIIGNEPLGEGLLESTRDAVTRFLKPGGRLIPMAIQIYALPMSLPHDLIAEQLFTPTRVKQWQTRYGVDFSPLLEFNQFAQATDLILPQDLADCNALSAPILLNAIDLADIQEITFERHAQGHATEDGQINALFIGFRLQLTPTLWLSTLPDEADDDNHWLASVKVFAEPLTVAEGDAIRVRYRYDSDSRLHDFDMAIIPA